MTRASISLSEPNDAWIQAQIDSKEFASRSDVLNDLIRKARADARERDYVRAKLMAAEDSVSQHGWVKETPKKMLEGFKDTARKHGKL